MLWKCPYFPCKNVFYYIAVNNNETAYNDLRLSYFWYKPSILQFSLFFYWCKLIFDLQKKELLVGLFKYLRQLVFLKQKCLICIFNYCCFEVNTAVNPGTLQHLRWSSFRQYFWVPIFCCKVICLKFSWVSVPASYKMCIQTMQYNEIMKLMEKVILIFSKQKSSVLYMEQVLTSNWQWVKLSIYRTLPLEIHLDLGAEKHLRWRS